MNKNSICANDLSQNLLQNGRNMLFCLAKWNNFCNFEAKLQ